MADPLYIQSPRSGVTPPVSFIIERVAQEAEHPRFHPYALRWRWSREAAMSPEIQAVEDRIQEDQERLREMKRRNQQGGVYVEMVGVDVQDTRS